MIFILARNILGTDYCMSVAKSILFRKPKELKVGTIAFLADRLYVGVFLLFFPVIFLLLLRKKKAENFIYEPSRQSQSGIKMRKEYISHYFLNDCDIYKVDNVSGTKVYISFEHLVHKIMSTFFLWLLSVKAFVVAFCVRRKWPSRMCIRLIITLLNAIWTEKENNSIYCFKIYNIVSYLTAVLSSRLAPENSYVFVGGNSYFMKGRYFYAPRVSLCVCAKYQIDEIETYRKLKWIIVKDAFYKGLEEYSIYKNLKHGKITYDIGVYSSGWWARKDGLLRVSDYEGIKALKYSDNSFHKDFLDVLNEVISLKEKYNFRVKLYLHPYERMLLHEYKITVPYLNQLIEAHIDIDDSAGRSIDKLYECKIGVSLFSTIIADRWEYDLKGLIYYTENYKEFICPQYMGKYRNYIYTSVHELEEKIVGLLNIKSNADE